MDTFKRWTRKSSADKTCANMKTFMRIEHSDLKEVGGLSIQLYTELGTYSSSAERAPNTNVYYDGIKSQSKYD